MFVNIIPILLIINGIQTQLPVGPPIPSCYMNHDNSTYICDVNYGCICDFPISCMDDIDCQIRCNAKHSCSFASIKCPQHANCHVICGYEFACDQTNITWSKNFFRSTLTCNSIDGIGNGCDYGTTLPPQHYQYHFTDNVNKNVKITNASDIYFELKLNPLNNASYKSIISIINEETNIEVMKISMNDQENMIQIIIGDTYLIHGVIPADNEYHSVNIILNQQHQNIFKIDDIIYLQYLSDNTESSFSSLFSNNQSYSVLKTSETISIKNLSININLLDYFYTDSGHNASLSDSFCFSHSHYLGIEFRTPIVAYWRDTMYIFDGYVHDTLFFSNSLAADSIQLQAAPLSLSSPPQFEHQSWTQINNVIYFIGTYGLSSLDLSTKPYRSVELSPHPTCGGTCCLCHNNTHLFTANKFFIGIYEISSRRWINTNVILSANIVFKVAFGPTCQFYKNKMYIFGGSTDENDGYYASFSPLNTIYEYNAISGILTVLKTTLPTPAHDIKSIIHNQYIYLYAGYLGYHYTGSSVFNILIFDAINHSISLSLDETFYSYGSACFDDQQRKMMVDTEFMYYYEDDAALLDFNNMLSQLIIPGNSFFVSFNISECSPITSDYITFTLRSDDASIGVNHDVIITNGKCNQICNVPYGVCTPCYYGITPLIPKKINVTSFVISISSKTQMITPIPSDTITVSVSECPLGFGYDNDAILLDCNECPINTFKIQAGNEACYQCKEENGFSCDGSFNITVSYNLWFTAWSKETQQFISPFKITSNDEIYAIKCAPQFCCQFQRGCSYLNSFNFPDVYKPKFGGICAEFRDHTVHLCSKCIDGTYELFGTTACGPCEDLSNLMWLIPILIICAVLVLVLLIDSKPINVSLYTAQEADYKKILQKDEINAMTIMILKVFMYYFQSLGQVLSSQNISNALLPLVSWFSLSLDYNASSSSNSGLCILPFITSPLLEILYSAIFIALLIFNMLWMGCLSECWYKTKSNQNQQQSEQTSTTLVDRNSSKPVISVVILKIFVITAGTVLGMAFKLLSCITMPRTGDMVHFYDATTKCFDTYWFFGLVLCVGVILFFVVLFIKIYCQQQNDRESPHNVYRKLIKPFKSKYWWFEFALFSRRLLISAFSSLRLLSSADIDIILQGLLMIYFALHCVICPFKYKRLNVVEGVCLFTLLIIISGNNRINKDNQTFTDIFIGFAIILPFVIIFYYVIKSMSVCYSSKTLKVQQMQKMNQRAQMPMDDIQNEISGKRISNDDIVLETINDTKTNLDEIEMGKVKVGNAWNGATNRESISSNVLESNNQDDIEINNLVEYADNMEHTELNEEQD
eukprot:155355_1